MRGPGLEEFIKAMWPHVRTRPDGSTFVPYGRAPMGTRFLMADGAVLVVGNITDSGDTHGCGCCSDAERDEVVAWEAPREPSWCPVAEVLP
jgi:hypothetical protein